MFIDRREFIALAAAGGISLILDGCGGDGPTQPDLVLTGTESDAQTLADQFHRLEGLAKNPGNHYRVGFNPNSRAAEVLDFSIQPKNDFAVYPHLQVRRESTGETANLVFWRKDLSPGVRFVDNQGKTLVKNNRPIELSLADFSQNRSLPTTAADWIKLGVEVAAIAFAIWLGAKIAGWILAAIAFVAFNLMVLAIVVAAVAVVAPLIEWLIKVTGLNWQNVKNFFDQLVSQIIQLFQGIANLLQRQGLAPTN